MNFSRKIKNFIFLLTAFSTLNVYAEGEGGAGDTEENPPTARDCIVTPCNMHRELTYARGIKSNLYIITNVSPRRSIEDNHEVAH